MQLQENIGGGKDIPANMRLMNHLGAIHSSFNLAQMQNTLIHSIASKRTQDIEQEEGRVRQKYDCIFAIQPIIDELKASEIESEQQVAILVVVTGVFESQYVLDTMTESLDFIDKILMSVENINIQAIQCRAEMERNRDDFMAGSGKSANNRKNGITPSGLYASFEDSQAKVEAIKKMSQDCTEKLQEIKEWRDEEGNKLEDLRTSTGLKLHVS